MLPVLTLLVVATPYDVARGNAETVRNLGRFLEEYVGDCEHDDPRFDKKGCEVAAKQTRDRYAGRTLLIEIDNPSEQIKVAKFDQQKGMFQILLTPFFSERGLGLSVGKPSRLTPEGFPVVKNIPVWVKLPAGEPEFVFRRQLDRGLVKLEMIIKPKRGWRMTTRSGEAVRGAEVALVGIRVYATGGNSVLAEQTY